MRKTTRILWVTLVAAAWLGGIAGVLFFLPFSQLKPLVDHLSRDGHLDSFTLGRYQSLSVYLPWLGLLLVLVGLLAVVFHRMTRAWMERLVDFILFQFKNTWSDIKLFWQGIRAWRPAIPALLALAGITLVAIFVRLAFVNRAFSHDEAYTFEAFAVRPFFKIITDYSLPNNHVLHTIFVRISYLLFGDSPLAVRLPALAAGVLMAPATYLWAKQLYDRRVAFLSAGLVAAAPVMINFSTNARGYTMLSLFTLVTFSLGVYVSQNKNRFAWLLLAVLSALGFYTLPVMLYPYGILMVWLFLSAVVGDRGQAYPSFGSMLRYIVVSGIVTVILTLLFYLPIFVFSGVASVTSNTFVSSLSWVDFRQTLPVRLLETWQSWLQDVPPGIGYIMAAGVILSVIFHRKISRQKIPFPVAAILWIALALLVQRPNPWGKVWTYLFPPLMIWGSAGLLAVFKLLPIRIGNKFHLGSALAGAATLAILAAGFNYGIKNIPRQNATHEIEAAAIYLSSRLQPADRIAMDYPMDVTFWYYARRHNISQDYFFNVPGRPYDHVYVIVNPNFEQTVYTVLETRAKDGIFCRLDSIQKDMHVDNTEIYDCDRP
jgi:hypothetical protein